MKLIYEDKRIFGLDLMRATAIILVLFGHCAWIFPHGGSTVRGFMGLAAYLGVEVFFVLSGFLIGKILLQMFRNGSFCFRSVMLFLKRRWFRTLPNYYLILLVNLVIAYYIGYQAQDSWRYFFFLQNFSDTMRPFFPESWSLSVEEFAYIVLPVTLFLTSLMFVRRKTSHFIIVTLILICLVFINRILYHVNTSVSDLVHWNISLKSVTVFRLDSILIGVLCSVFYTRWPLLWKNCRFPGFIIGTVSVIFLAFGLGHAELTIELNPFFWNVLYLPLTSVTIAMFLPLLSQWENTAAWVRTPVVYVSVLSYSLYLVHYGIVLQLLRYNFSVTSASPVELFFFVLAYLSFSFVLSFLLYKYFEKPATDLRDNAGMANLERFFPIRRALKK